MLKQKLTILVLLVFVGLAQAQQNFTITPEKPKPGDVIQITYKPAGDIANTLGKVEAVAYITSKLGRTAEDVILKKSGKKYTATITTDTTATFIHLGFHVDNKYDNNFNDGYYIQLYKGDQPRKGSYGSLGVFYQTAAQQTGVEKNSSKALVAYAKEFELYPTQKSVYGVSYYRVMLADKEKKEEATALAQKEIEAAIKGGLATERDYMFVEGLYTALKLPEQAKYFSKVKKEKFPEGKWLIDDLYDQFYNEKDIDKQKAILTEIKKNAETNPAWKDFVVSTKDLESMIASGELNKYIKNKDWAGLKQAAASPAVNKTALASVYNSAAWKMQEKNEDLKAAEEMAKFATEQSLADSKNPAAKPSYMTAKQWERNAKFTYAMFADTYAMVLYRLGDYKKGFEQAKESAITVNQRNNPAQNQTYVLLAEKVLSSGQAFKEIEDFVRKGKATSEIREVLKRLYAVNNQSDADFDTYLVALQEETRKKMIEEIRKSMLNEAVAGFVIKDINGNKITSVDWKGKVVVVDFWATWCGPCVASFPGMQLAVNKFKDDPNVKFVFIDTWENVENKEKNAGDFIASNRYTFDVLMDNDNKVVEQFKVSGIPTKFVLDKEGNIRFKAVGYNGDNDKLVEELTNMIALAGGKEIE